MSYRSDPATQYFAVTPNDATPLPNGQCKALYVGGAGNVVVRGANVDVTFTNVPAGFILPIETNIVKATGTTATGIIALY